MFQAEHIKIAEACRLAAGHAFRGKPQHDAGGNVRVVQPKDISMCGVLKTDELCQVDLTPRRLLYKGDVLLINRGRFTAALFTGTLNAPCIATSAFMILTPSDPAVLAPAYLTLYLNSKEGRTQLARFTEASTTPFISRANLATVTIPVPPSEQQQKLIALEQAKQRYVQLTTRKTELLDGIINHQLI